MAQYVIALIQCGAELEKLITNRYYNEDYAFFCEKLQNNETKLGASALSFLFKIQIKCTRFMLERFIDNFVALDFFSFSLC
ncbi:hypothetical protein PA25_25100 [Pseudoalteromonas sp. A25]|nr:hypothetical protein PA25_25100 [Pseudoalteromonas sp. A25]